MDEDYDESIGMTNELLDEFVYIMTDEYGFDLSNKENACWWFKFSRDYTAGIMDRHYGIENEMIQNIDEAIEEIKSRHEKEEVS